MPSIFSFQGPYTVLAAPTLIFGSLCTSGHSGNVHPTSSSAYPPHFLSSHAISLHSYTNTPTCCLQQLSQQHMSFQPPSSAAVSPSCTPPSFHPNISLPLNIGQVGSGEYRTQGLGKSSCEWGGAKLNLYLLPSVLAFQLGLWEYCAQGSGKSSSGWGVARRSQRISTCKRRGGEGQ